jgi:hypothetical protein
VPIHRISLIYRVMDKVGWIREARHMAKLLHRINEVALHVGFIGLCNQLL